MRTEFPNPVKRAALERAAGICECHRIEGVPGLVPGGCGAPIGPGNTWFEHVDPDGAGGGATLENCAVLTPHGADRWTARTEPARGECDAGE